MAGEAKQDAPASGKSSRLVPILIIAGVMIVEGVGVFAFSRFMSPGPPEAMAGEEAGEGDGAFLVDDEYAEIALASCRPTNRNGPKVATVRIRVSALVRADLLEKMKERVTQMQSRIDDRVNFVVRSADQKHLNEPGLETIKRQLKREMDLLFGDEELIIDVLVPELLQTG